MAMLWGSHSWRDVEHFFNSHWLQEGSVLHRISLGERGEQSGNTQPQQRSGCACKPFAVKPPHRSMKGSFSQWLISSRAPSHQRCSEGMILSYELKTKPGVAALHIKKILLTEGCTWW